MLTRITEEISLIKVKFHNIHTSVFLIKLDTGYALFDSGTTESDVNETIMPAITMAGIKPIEVRFLFISHTHSDHFGGAAALLSRLPAARLVLSDTDRAVRDGFADRLFEGEPSEYSPIVTLSFSGHSRDCLALYDARTSTLLSGDAVQLFGVSRWGTGVSDIDGYFAALDLLREMSIELLVTSHEYYPLGQIAAGRLAVGRYLDVSEAALRELIAYYALCDNGDPEESALRFTESKREENPDFPIQQAGAARAIFNWISEMGS